MLIHRSSYFFSEETRLAADSEGSHFLVIIISYGNLGTIFIDAHASLLTFDKKNNS